MHTMQGEGLEVTLGPYALRPFQERAIPAARAALARLKAAGRPLRILLVAPCGAGKTIVSSAFMRAILDKGNSCVFLASGRILIDQKSRKLAACGICHNVIMANSEPYPVGEDEEAKHCAVASKDTLAARAIAINPSAVFVDEAHVSTADGWVVILEPQRIVIGMTATPITGDGHGLGWYEEIVELATHEELLREKFIVPCRVFAPFTVSMFGAKKSGDDWSEAEVEKRFNHRVLHGKIVESWLKHGQDRPTLVFASSRAHGRELTEEFNGRGIVASFIDGDTPDKERERIYGLHRTGQERVLVSCGVFIQGADFPWVSCGVLAFSTASLRKLRQTTGRIFRIDPDNPAKIDALILDHGGNTDPDRHGWPQWDLEWSLDTGKEIEVKEAGERKPPGPTFCHKCGEQFRASLGRCPHCGNVLRSKLGRNEIEVVDGELREVKRSAPRKPAVGNQKIWSQCVGIAANRGLTVNSAAGIFHKRTDQWPRDVPGLKPEYNYHQGKMLAAVVWPGFVRKKKEPV